MQHLEETREKIAMTVKTKNIFGIH